jgi:Ni/Co efflux regulator RcnB
MGSGAEEHDEGGYGSAPKEVTKVKQSGGARGGVVDPVMAECRSRRHGVEDRGWSHRSGNRWPGDREVGWHRVRSTPCTWRRGARVSWFSIKIKVDGLLVV